MSEPTPIAPPLLSYQSSFATFRPNRASGLLAVSFVTLCFLVDLARLICLILLMRILHRHLAGTAVPDADFLAAIARLNALMWIGMGLDIVTPVFFLMWMWRANRNLLAFGHEYLDHGPAAVILWWFVPFANLVMPYRVMREIYQLSDPDGRPDSTRLLRPATLVGWWWGFYVTSAILNFVVNVLVRAGGADSHKAVLGDLYLLLPTFLPNMACAVLTILLVLRINRDQRFALTAP